MTERSQRWLTPFVALVAVAVVAVTVARLHSTKEEVIPFKVAAEDLVHLQKGETITLNDPDPSKVYVVESGAHVKITRPMGDRLQVKTLDVLVQTGGTLEDAEGTNIFVIALADSVSHVGDGVFIEAFGGEVFASGTSKVKAMDKSTIHNTGTGDEHAYAGSTTYSRMRGRVFASDGATVYIKSPDNCDACAQVEFSSGSTVYVYAGAEAFGRGSSETKRANVTVYDDGEVGCYKYCEIWSYPKAELHEGAYPIVHYVTAADRPVIPFPDGEESDGKRPDDD